MSRPIVTLTTDFGLRDPYVAEIKAVILSISPNASVVDISHEIEKFNIRMAAYILASAAPYFPKDTIHVTVVDPSVGTKRRPIIIQTRHGYYVGPDNGVLTLAAKNQAVEHIYEISNRKFMLPRISNTFHGRDIFAPVAAHMANGIAPAKFGPEINEIVTPMFAQVSRQRNTIVGEVLHIDSFGNIITNLGKKEIEVIGIKDDVDLMLKRVRLRLKFCKAYAETKPQQPLAIIGSHNFLEISINQGDAAQKFKAKIGDKVTLCRSYSSPGAY